MPSHFQLMFLIVIFRFFGECISLEVPNQHLPITHQADTPDARNVTKCMVDCLTLTALRNSCEYGLDFDFDSHEFTCMCQKPNALQDMSMCLTENCPNEDEKTTDGLKRDFCTRSERVDAEHVHLNDPSHPELTESLGFVKSQEILQSPFATSAIATSGTDVQHSSPSTLSELPSFTSAAWKNDQIFLIVAINVIISSLLIRFLHYCRYY
ncbi:hypothetical protein DL96DRAFT_1600135 [Flagelloscypha sp. PMI_526]|nr:hypothetical protein DL96DRAFT_1600135 [Flagelloscypha sp. PMI_526]